MNNTGNQNRSFVELLKEYKEFIAILVFFAGGFMWIFGFFATKKQVKVAQCLANQNIALIESRMQTKFLSDELTQKSMELINLLKKDQTLLADTMKIQRLKIEIELIKANLKESEKRYNEILIFLRHDKCQDN